MNLDDDAMKLRTSRQLSSAGMSGWEQSRAAGDGTFQRVRRGVYMSLHEWAGLTERAQFVARAQAATLTRPKGIVFSHVTAGILHDLPLLGPLPERLDVLMQGATGGRSEAGLLSHRSPDGDVTIEVHGVRATTIERTLVDVGATSSLRRSLVMCDAAIRRELTDQTKLSNHVTARTSLRGRPRARRLISLADARAESVAESFSRAHMIENSFQLPDLQRKFRLPEGWRPRVDFYWPDLGLVGECDGFVNYGRRGGEVNAEALWYEKQREDAIRASGLRVIRWIWNDIWRAEPLTRLLLRAGVPRS